MKNIIEVIKGLIIPFLLFGLALSFFISSVVFIDGIQP